MFLVTLYRITKTALASFWRNWWLSLAATLIMILTLITISFFASLLVITDKTTQTLKDKADLTVYFNDSTSKDQIFALQSSLMSRPDVKNVEYTSKEKALEAWKEMNKDNPQVRDSISESDNPLPRSLGIKTQKPEDLENINAYLSKDEFKGLIKEDGISYKKNRDLIDRLVKITNFIKTIGYTLSFVFVLISVLIVYNTIRLTIFARSEEIEIMKLVGGSDWYVRGPFVMEGIGYGLLGAVGSSIVFYFLFKLFVPVSEKYLGLSNFNSSYLGVNIALIILMQFFVGLIMGGSCSVVAIKKHLSK